MYFKDSMPDKCVPCLTGKMASKPFPRTEGRRATTPLELVHSDVCGPLPVSSWGGSRYLLTFTDDCTRKTFDFLMRNKTEMWSLVHPCLMSTALVMMVISARTVTRR